MSSVTHLLQFLSGFALIENFRHNKISKIKQLLVRWGKSNIKLLQNKVNRNLE